MPKLYETLSRARQLDLAVQSKTPARLAQTFAAFVGQFYDRTDFDTLARQVSECYEAENTDDAYRFRSALDRRLNDRYHTPVVWNVSPRRTDRAA
jgi:hypothetical protein